MKKHMNQKHWEYKALNKNSTILAVSTNYV